MVLLSIWVMIPLAYAEIWNMKYTIINLNALTEFFINDILLKGQSTLTLPIVF